MSRLAKKPIIVPIGTEIKKSDSYVVISGSKGEMSFILHKSIEIVIENNLLYVKQIIDIDYNKALLGTVYALLSNIIFGVNNLFSKKLILKGVGYRAKVEKNVLELLLGYSHSVFYKIPSNINVCVLNNVEIVISGICKIMVGQVAADIRNKRIPEAYKGKGIRYSDEIIFLKETKKK
ncbi:MAG: 50S ribosomal protein L6 [Candidatus Azosocius agrarius]|nr:MAG: 50S ribosomal protein L6 [Gammaproteobacteria bacterium]